MVTKDFVNSWIRFILIDQYQYRIDQCSCFKIFCSLWEYFEQCVKLGVASMTIPRSIIIAGISLSKENI